MPDSFIIRWEVDRVSELTQDGCFAPVEYHFELPWSLFVRKETSKRTSNIPHLGVHLCCNEESSCNLWNANVKQELILVHRTNEEKNVHRINTILYDKEHRGWGYASFIPFSEILIPNRGFIRDDKIIIEARITIHSINFIRKLFTYDFTQPFPNADNAVLKLEDGTMHVCRKFLGWHSPYFASIFYENCKDNNTTEFEIKDVTTKDFSELLLSILPTESTIHLDSFKTILKLAELFQIERAFDLVENFLIFTINVSTSEKLLLAEKHKLELLKSHCFDSFKNLQDVKKLMTQPAFTKLPAVFKVLLLNKAFELIN